MARDEDLDVLYKPSSDDDNGKQGRACRRKCLLGALHLTLITTLIVTSSYYCIILYRQMRGCGLCPSLCEPSGPYTPEQVHLSLGANDSEYYVTWATMKPADTYLIWYKMPLASVHAVKGQRTDGLFESDTELGKKYRKYSYRAKMGGTDMVPNADYHYRVVACVDNEDNHTVSICDTLAESNPGALENKASYSSRLFEFSSKAYDDPSKPINLIFYGDLGLLNAQSVPRLMNESKSQDLIIHNGDFAYDLNTEHGKYGDRFMRLMEGIASRVPYQTSVGNHEIAGNFSEYNHRFTMVNRGPINHGAQNNFFYSFNAGPVHFVAISTEFYYFLDYVGLEPLVNQYAWLRKDLEYASSVKARAERPWIVVFGHRPMYCSSRDGDDCSKESNILRRGLPFVGTFALEKLFYDYGVDVELWSHEHQYERFLPIYDGQVYNGTQEDAYKNPRAPVHLISGSAGCQEKLDPFEGHAATGSVKQISDYGYTRIKASRCKLEFEQISDDQAGLVIDQFVMTKNQQNFPSKGQAIAGC